MLVFDGEEIPIDSVTCVSGGDDFSVGTVSDNGYRVFVDSSSTGVPNAQVLDPDSNQWSPIDRGESIEIGDNTYSSPATTYFDIRDSSREVDVVSRSSVRDRIGGAADTFGARQPMVPMTGWASAILRS